MKLKSSATSRRKFISGSALVAAGLLVSSVSAKNQELSQSSLDELYLVGPKKGFTPHVGALLSTMTMMRKWVVQQVRNLTTEELDFQIDEKSNSIGAMLYHLAATEKYYQLNTFDEMPWGSWDQSIKDEWDLPMNLGDSGREKIKGNDISFYLEKLESVRKVTIENFKTVNDDWLMKSELFFENKPTNNYCKWFHVCEHESNHNGQIKFIQGRFPTS